MQARTTIGRGVSLLTLLCFSVTTTACLAPPDDDDLQGKPLPLEGEPDLEMIADAPETAAAFAAAHPDLPEHELLDHLRLRIYLVAGSGETGIAVDGVTADGRDTYIVLDAEGHETVHPMPGWLITPEMAGDLTALGEDLEALDDQSPDGSVDALVGEVAEVLAQNEAGGFAGYAAVIQADLEALLAPPDKAAGGAEKNGGVVKGVCDAGFLAVVAAHFVALRIIALRIGDTLIPAVTKNCTAGAILVWPCVTAIARLSAAILLIGALGVILSMHGWLLSELNEWVIEIENAKIGKEAQAAADAEAAARTQTVKNMTTHAKAIFIAWAVAGSLAAATLLPSIIVATGAVATASVTWLQCAWMVVNPFWQNNAVKVAVLQGGPGAAAGAGGGEEDEGGGAMMPFVGLPGGGGPGGPPGGPGGPGFPADGARNPWISPLLTSLPDDLALQQQFEIDLEDELSPIDGSDMDNLIREFGGQSQGEYWGVGLCTKLILDEPDTGGPYDVLGFQTAEGFRLQEANTPYYLYSQGHTDGSWGNGINLYDTVIPTKYATLTQQRVCDGDDNNDGIDDAIQPGGDGFCYDEDGDGLEDLWSVSLDSQMPNQGLDRTMNCGGVGLDLIPKPQEGAMPNMSVPDILAALDGAEVSQTTIVHVTTQYRDPATGADRGTSGMLRFKVNGVLHLPDDPCYQYQYQYNPWGGGSWAWSWNYLDYEHGCQNGPGGGGGGPMPPI